MEEEIRLFITIEVAVVLTVIQLELPTMRYLTLYDVTPETPFHDSVAEDVETEVEVKTDVDPQVAVPEVVKFSEAEKAELPPEQTDCNWYS